MTYYIDGQEKNCGQEVGRCLKRCMEKETKAWTQLVLLCIGSDRITGDSLGPYIGYRLSGRRLAGTFIYGTLQEPVHALNLTETIRNIQTLHKNPLVIAIDASLGKKKHLGGITVGNGNLFPGAGVRKKLPPVGDIFITGIVNISGVPEQLSLQSTRLFTVISMAEAIAEGILLAHYSCRRRLLGFPQTLLSYPDEESYQEAMPSPMAAFTKDFL